MTSQRTTERPKFERPLSIRALKQESSTLRVTSIDVTDEGVGFASMVPMKTGSAIAVPKLPRLAYAFSMRYVLGLDGGGTKTECVLMDESRQVVTSSRGGPSNPIRVGFADASGAKASAGRVRKRT